jgi:SAM-dependent methyltransferase
MNRKERRVAAKRGTLPSAAGQHPPEIFSVADLIGEARRLYQQGGVAQAESVCQQILAREPAHVDALNLLGVIAQASGRHRLAVKMLTRAVASDALNAACHYNLGSSYQALQQRAEAAEHFKRAIALGLSDKNIEEFIVQNPVIAGCLDRLAAKWPLPIADVDLFGTAGLRPVADDLFLRCALESIVLRGATLEAFLTSLRAVLLRLASTEASAHGEVDEAVLACFCALAQQCFINEYVYVESEEETRQAVALRGRLQQQVAAAGEVSPLTLAAVAAYFPLHSLPGAEALLRRAWPETLAGLLRQQLREPLQERDDRSAIPVLTPIDDKVSLQVMQQYEENPYPRWIIDPLATAAAESDMPHEPGAPQEILVAGCGTGRQLFHVAWKFPQAQVLAIDISLPSLAYARRKVREAGLRNVDFAQADILKLATLGRSFDRIEAVGVLHHLADPFAGWRVLLSLLRPNGEMRIGLYSEAARRAIVEARELIAARGYRATIEDIRKCRQVILRGGTDGRWRRLTASADFYSISGCRDLLFNVMEHRFTIPQIKAFLEEQGLMFLGFDAEPEVVARFQQKFPDPAALDDLDCWQAFEAASPLAFRYMYVFSVRRKVGLTPPSPSPAA